MADDPQIAIRTESLTKIYNGRHIALNCLDLEVPTGASLGVVGPNGAGKTTLVRLLMGLQLPTAGRIKILGRSMTPNAAGLRRKIGYLPADPKFPPGMTAIEYLDFVGRLAGQLRNERRSKLAALLRAVDLLPIAGEPLKRLSTGMRTRLAIAASLINDPEILIWDEPSQGLDSEAKRTMLQLIIQLAETKTLVICGHQLADIVQVCSQSIVLNQGQVAFQGDLNDLRGTMRPSEIELILVGDKKEMTEAVKAINGLGECESCVLNKNLLRLRLRDNASATSILANVLVTLTDHKLELSDLKIGGGDPTEEVISRLLKEEGKRGFTRACKSVSD